MHFLNYRKIQPDPADVGITLADLVIARIGRDGRNTALGKVRAVLASHRATGQRNWGKYEIFETYANSCIFGSFSYIYSQMQQTPYPEAQEPA